MVIMFTAASARSAPRVLATLFVLLLFVVVQATALAHEIQHVLHTHDGPCGLHLVADHLAMAPAPVPTLAVTFAPTAERWVFCPGSRPVPPARPSVARAPPTLS